MNFFPKTSKWQKLKNKSLEFCPYFSSKLDLEYDMHFYCPSYNKLLLRWA